MQHKDLSRRVILVCAGLLIVASVVTAGAFNARRQRPSQKPQKKVLALPPVISHVPKLRIANVNVENPGTPEARAVIEILNTSHLAVMSVEISTKNKGDSGAVGVDGLTDPNDPKVVIPPFGTTTIHMNFGEMIPDAPLVISAAEFADGTEEGDEWSLKSMRAGRKRHQEQLRQEKKQKGASQP